MLHRNSADRQAAEVMTLSKHDMDLKTYLMRETNKGRSDTDIARDFESVLKPGQRVHRHTIRNWKNYLHLSTELRATHTGR